MTQYVTASFVATTRPEVSREQVEAALSSLLLETSSGVSAEGKTDPLPFLFEGDMVEFRHQGTVSSSFREVFDEATARLAKLCSTAFETELQTDAGPTACGHTYTRVVGPDQASINLFKLQHRLDALNVASVGLYVESAQKTATDLAWAQDPADRFVLVVVDEADVATPQMVFSVEALPGDLKKLIAVTASSLLASVATGREGRPMIVSCGPDQSMMPFVMDSSRDVYLDIIDEEVVAKCREVAR